MYNSKSINNNNRQIRFKPTITLDKYVARIITSSKTSHTGAPLPSCEGGAGGMTWLTFFKSVPYYICYAKALRGTFENF